MTDKPNIVTTTISSDVHQLPGIDTITYTYDRKEHVICLLIGNKGFARYEGEAADNIFKKVAGFVKDSDAVIDEAESRCRKAWGHDFELLRTRSQKRELVDKRYIIFWWMKQNSRKSLAAIGAVLGTYDHATVLYACAQVAKLMDNDFEFKIKVEQFLNAI